MNPVTPVKGYQPQSNTNLNLVNNNKEAEERILRILDDLKLNPQIDPRWLALGRTQIEQGFMAVNRAIFNPSRVEIPE